MERLAGAYSFDWAAFDATMTPILDASPAISAFQSPKPAAALERQHYGQFYRSLADHLSSRGWTDRVYVKIHDEPTRADYDSVARHAEVVREASPQLKVLLTEPFTRRLSHVVDIWAVDIPLIGDTIRYLPVAWRGDEVLIDHQFLPPASVYSELVEQEAWIYTHGSSQNLWYPNLFVDSPAMSHRIIPWLAMRYGFTGFLYWKANVMYELGDPWSDQFFRGAHGEGNLVYPGIPERTGRGGHEPIGSLRLKLLREGIEDYETLHRLSHRAAGVPLRSLHHRVVQSSLAWTRDTGRFHRQKENIISRLSTAGPSAAGDRSEVARRIGRR